MYDFMQYTSYPADCITITGNEGYYVEELETVAPVEEYKMSDDLREFLEEQAGKIDFEYYASLPVNAECPF